MTDDDLTRLRDEVAGVLEREYGCKPGMVHEGYGAECASAAHAPALYRTFGCDHVAHLADALLSLLARKIAEARGEALRSIEALADEWAAIPPYLASVYDRGRVDQRQMCETELRAALAEPTGPKGER